MDQKPLSLFETVQARLDEVAGMLDLEPGIHAILRQPMRELQVGIPVRMD